MEIEDQEQEIMLEPELLSSVISVNGKTGNVVLTTSDLENDSDYQTGEDVQNALEGAIGTGTLTVQKNSTTVGTFNANSDTDTTINLSVPTTTSELTNDANYQTGNEVANSIGAHNQSSSAHQDIRQAITDEQNARINADNGLQGQIDAITSASDVVDIVGTYAALEAYDTQHLKDNDVIKVLQDETHNEAMSYYRWSTTTQMWTYIGSEGPYYTKSETNTLLDEKLDADEVPDGFFDGPATVNPTPATSIEIEDSIKLDTVQLNGDTFQQTYSGKNLINLPDVVRIENNVTVRASGTNHVVASGLTGSSAGVYFSNSRIVIDFDTTGNFTFSISEALPRPLYIRFYDDLDTNLGQISISEGDTSATGTIPAGATKYWILFTPLPNTQYDFDIYLQFEKGDTATEIEPYTGMIPAPNPDYPQNIDVVTGAQTITLTDGDSQSQSFAVNLGSIELCKIGTYQDYIYKSNNNWYIHKEIDKYTFDGTETWSPSPYGTNSWRFVGILSFSFDTDKLQVISNIFTGIKHADRNTAGSNTIYSAGNSELNIRNTNLTTESQVQTATDGNYVYYALATPTDTQIADSSLIAQLEALLKATLYQPTTTITTTGSLPAILNITAFTDNLNGVLEICGQSSTEGGTYYDFVGTDGISNGVAGLVPAPTTADAGKFLKADGTWASGGGGTSYSAGTGINITSNTISVDTTTIQPKLTAGANITIDQNNEIAATDTTYTAGTNVNISAQNVISATDTTYSNFVGTDGNTGGTAGLVPAPTTSDTDKYLKSDGTWATVSGGGGGVTVVQTTGTSTTDVMSQDAVTKMVYPMITTKPDTISIRGTAGIDTAIGDSAVGIGPGAFARGERSVSIGLSTQNYASGDRCVTIGNFAETKNNSKAVAVGNSAKCTAAYSVALGDSATATRVGEVNVGAGSSGEGYNSTNYRVLGGVHDGQLAQDAVTVNQVNSVIDAINTALSTSIPHIGA